MDFIKDVVPLLTNLGIFGFATWGIQKIINNSSERKFAEYKSMIDLQLMSYKNQYDNQVELHKSELKFLNDRLVSLHSERLKVIKELNEKLVNLHSAMVRLVSMRPAQAEKAKELEVQERIQADADKAFAEYSNFILYNSIYFDKALAAKLENIQREYGSARYDFFEPQLLQSWGMTKGEAFKESGKKVIEASKRIRDQIPQLINEVADDFREILGVGKQ